MSDLMRKQINAIFGRKGVPIIALNLPPELEKRLEALEKATGRSKNSVLEEAIAEYVGDLEDLYLAEKESRDIKEGRSSTRPLADVMKQYGLDN